MRLLCKALIIVLAGLLFVLAHEGGHYMAAASFGLNPRLTFDDSANGIFGMSIGVTHAPTTVMQDYIIVMAAFVFPLFCALYFATLNTWGNNETLWLLSAVFVVMIIATLIPFPGIQQLDSNRIFHALFGL